MKINNRGAASILVVLIIVVLATFSGVALTSSWTNKNLAIKAAQSKIDFYALDSVAEEIIAELDEQLYISANETTDYLNSLKVDSQSVINSEDARLQALLNEDLDGKSSSAMHSLAIKHTYARIFYYYCALNLQKYADNKGMTLHFSDDYIISEDFLNPEKRIPTPEDLKLEFQVSSGEKPGQKKLLVVISVVSPNPSVKIISNEDWKTKFEVTEANTYCKYEIFSWKQSYNPIEYDTEPQRFG